MSNANDMWQVIYLPEQMDNYKFFSNKKCEYYPCHKGLEEINCLFCYCPLYLTECSGNYTILDSGIKDCSNCSIPHDRNNYDYIIKRLCEEYEKREVEHDG